MQFMSATKRVNVFDDFSEQTTKNSRQILPWAGMKRSKIVQCQLENLFLQHTTVWVRGRVKGFGWMNKCAYENCVFHH